MSTTEASVTGKLISCTISDDQGDVGHLVSRQGLFVPLAIHAYNMQIIAHDLNHRGRHLWILTA